MFFKPYYLGCLAHASYLIGGDNGDAAVIDPRRDVDEYLADAEAAGRPREPCPFIRLPSVQILIKRRAPWVNSLVSCSIKDFLQ